VIKIPDADPAAIVNIGLVQDVERVALEDPVGEVDAGAGRWEQLKERGIPGLGMDQGRKEDQLADDKHGM